MRDQAENQGDFHKKTKTKNDQFEFCKVCRLNHDQGRRHKYFPNHVKSLSSFLSRFQNKLSDVRFFLKNPSLLRPEHASRNRLWCVFCDADIDGVGSSYACGNAINHLASADHLKNLKSFVWNYGGGKDRVDSFMISEADLEKWEKKCESLKTEAGSEASCKPLIGPSNDIHTLNSECINCVEKTTNHFLISSFSNGVVPLQNHTNESHQVSHSELSEVTWVGANRYLPAGTSFGTSPWGYKDLTGYVASPHCLVWNGGKWSGDDNHSNRAQSDERTSNAESSSQSLPALTQISSIVRDEAKRNVHSGAPPPWFDASDENSLDNRLKPGVGSSKLSSPNKSGKSQKLNPKRVGAAWAEKRKIELEMEKRGEIITTNFDANWLPNFGGVWQSGSRKESRKDFKVQNKNSLEDETQPETLINIKPYVSKRKRTDTD